MGHFYPKPYSLRVKLKLDLSNYAPKTNIKNTVLKVAKRGVFSGPNTGKYEAEKTWYSGIFHAVKATVIFDTSLFAAKVNLYNLKSNVDKLELIN